MNFKYTSNDIPKEIAFTFNLAKYLKRKATRERNERVLKQLHVQGEKK